MPGEVDLCPLDFSPHLLETKSLERKLEPVGVGDFGATPHRSGLVLHDGQWAIIRTSMTSQRPDSPRRSERTFTARCSFTLLSAALSTRR